MNTLLSDGLPGNNQEYLMQCAQVYVEAVELIVVVSHSCFWCSKE